MRRQANQIIIESFPVGSFACNCSIIYHATTKDAIIIDPGNDAKIILDFINKYSLNVKKLIHTHAHFDHIGHSDQLRKKTGATIHLQKDDLFLYNLLPQQALFFGETVLSADPVDAFIEDNELFKIDYNKKGAIKTVANSLETLHTPGHTPGSCCFYTEFFEQPLLFSGDTLFSQSIGRTDLPGGDSDLILKSIKKRLWQLPEETICIPGHGPTTNIYREKKTNPFLQT
ncbi:MAG: MBL fold metallo-hydrolase [Zetaproteobacteria bacterium]|nr:MBL fold metallo-hydrolase [Pseudobdellovibrionaceae bacterium]